MNDELILALVAAILSGGGQRPLKDAKKEAVALAEWATKALDKLEGHGNGQSDPEET
jgi:hypothetical protein